MAAPTSADWGTLCLQTLYGLTHGKRAPEVLAEKLQTAVRNEMAPKFSVGYYSTGNVTEALTRLERQGKIASKAAPPKRDGKQAPGKTARAVYGSVAHVKTYTITEDGVRAANALEGKGGATAKKGKAAKSK